MSPSCFSKQRHVWSLNGRNTKNYEEINFDLKKKKIVNKTLEKEHNRYILLQHNFNPWARHSNDIVVQNSTQRFARQLLTAQMTKVEPLICCESVANDLVRSCHLVLIVSIVISTLTYFLSFNLQLNMHSITRTTKHTVT
jgi:hypothetical protein